MKVLICPLNWGLGHATRCVPLIKRQLDEGNDVTIAADGLPLCFLQEEFPGLSFIEYKSYPVRYSAGKSQVGAIFRCLPGIIRRIWEEHYWLKRLLQTTHFDRVISDNRFGMWSRDVESVYITHQLMIKMPRGFAFLQPLAWLIHRIFISRYSECWVPDYAEAPGLSGDLSHKYPLRQNIRFIGPLSRFDCYERTMPNCNFDTVVIISGIEPQRSLFEKNMLDRLAASSERVLIIQGLPGETGGEKKIGNITLRPHIGTAELAGIQKGARKIISRSGYSTIMDLTSLGCLDKAEFIPTPGQPEQEYLALLHDAKNLRPEYLP